MKNYVYEGDSLVIATTNAYASGGVVKEGQIFGFAQADSSNGEVAVLVEGVFDILNKENLEIWAVGDPVFYSNATSNFSKTTSAGAVKIGYCIAAAATGTTTARIRLVPTIG